MLFSSTIFLFAFLPITLLIYYVVLHQRTLRNIFLLLVSLFFYAWGEPKFVLVMLLSIVMNYLFGLWADQARGNKAHARAALTVMVLFNLSIFFVFKYLNFTVYNLNLLFGDILPQTNIILPIGISFFTFQAMSYVFDVYRENGAVQKNPLNVGLYIAFFPQLIAGPIVRYETVAEQINFRKETFADTVVGVQRFLMGLSKKVLLSNTMAVLADHAFDTEEYSNLSVGLALLGICAYTLQIFFDFSGYSDMAIGLGKMFGFHFDENFDYPYISKSVSEFWRRWHISLGTWFRDYIYFPMGGSRVSSKARLVFNLFVVWTLTGVWHGASWNFILWGLFYFAILAFEKLSGYPNKFRSKPPKILYQAFTMFCVMLGWILFRATDLSRAASYIQATFGLAGNVLWDDAATLYLREYALFFLFGILFSIPVVPWLKKKAHKKHGTQLLFDSTFSVALLALFVVSVSYLIKGTYNPFIYFNF